jgi:hypothetical protein
MSDSRQETRDDPAAVPAIDKKITVSGYDYGIRLNFGHADEASIGQAHRHIGIFVHQRKDGLQLSLQIELRRRKAAPQQGGQFRSSLSTQQMESFR